MHFVPGTWICSSETKEQNGQEPRGKENGRAAAKAGSSLGGGRLGTRRRRPCFPPRAPATRYFASSEVPRSAEGERDLLLLQPWEPPPGPLRRGVNLHGASAGAGRLKFSSPASKSPGDSDDIIPQLVSCPLQPSVRLGALPRRRGTERSMPPRIQPREKGFAPFKRNNQDGAAWVIPAQGAGAGGPPGSGNGP